MITHLNASEERPARVIVLGASGFVGADAVRRLNEAGMTTLGLASADVDLCAAGAVEALRGRVRHDDVMVIVSALTPDRGKDIGTFMRNVTMGAHLSAFLEQAACSHVVYISSDAVYGEPSSLIREETPCRPDSRHGLMHVVREQLLTQAVAARTPLLILRPGPLYGPGDPHQSYGPNRFIRTALAEGLIRLFGGGEERRDHVYVEDLSRLIAQCVLRRSVGCLNVATGQSVSFASVAGLVARLCDGPVRIEPSPRQAAATHRFFEVSARLKAFPAFRHTPLDEGLAKTFQGCAGSHGNAAGAVMAEAEQPTRGGAA